QLPKEDAQSAKLQVSIGSHLPFRMTAQMPPYMDPVDSKGDFVEVPNVDYETYMDGYFQELISHEVGHNLGLRHNFRGNHGAADAKAEGNTSRSIMEYLGRPYRYLNRISAYDIMAIRYGYRGEKPTQKDWFCTDEDVALGSRKDLSAECSRD